MVVVLYAIILILVVVYLIFSVFEIWSAIQLARNHKSKKQLYIQITGELTHTILVFGYAQFMVTHSSLLTQIGATLYVPISLLISMLVVRGALYLYIFHTDKPPRSVYLAFISTYLMGVVALVWALAIIVPKIIFTGYVPDTESIEAVAFVAPFVLAILIVPIYIVYTEAIKKLKQ